MKAQHTLQNRVERVSVQFASCFVTNKVGTIAIRSLTFSECLTGYLKHLRLYVRSSFKFLIEDELREHVHVPVVMQPVT